MLSCLKPCRQVSRSKINESSEAFAEHLKNVLKRVKVNINSVVRDLRTKRSRWEQSKVIIFSYINQTVTECCSWFLVHPSGFKKWKMHQLIYNMSAKNNAQEKKKKKENLFWLRLASLFSSYIKLCMVLIMTTNMQEEISDTLKLFQLPGLSSMGYRGWKKTSSDEKTQQF